MDYAAWIFHILGLPTSTLPQVVDDAGEHFGTMSADILGMLQLFMNEFWLIGYIFQAFPSQSDV